MWTNESFVKELHLELWWIEWAVNHKQKSYPREAVKDLVQWQGIGGCRLGWWGDFKKSKWIRVELTKGVPSPAWEKDKAIGKEWCSRHPWSLVSRLVALKVLWSCRSISQITLLLLCSSLDRSASAACSHKGTSTKLGGFPYSWAVPAFQAISAASPTQCHLCCSTDQSLSLL